VDRVESRRPSRLWTARSFCIGEATDDKTVRVMPDAVAPPPSVPKEKFPCWLKLVRQGNEFTGYESLDGETWWLDRHDQARPESRCPDRPRIAPHTRRTRSTTSVFDHVTLTKTSK